MRVAFIVWALGVGLVASWTFAPAEPPPPSILEVNRGLAFGPNEAISIDGRKSIRQYALNALDLPWGSRCSGEGRKRFIDGLNNYYYHRQNQSERYPETYGKLGADYIAKQWSTTDDLRIERLTQDAYVRGYLKLADFQDVAGRLVATIIRDERTDGKACSD